MTSGSGAGRVEDRQLALARAFVDLADTLVNEFDVVDFMQLLTVHCIDLLGVDAAGVMLDDQRGGLAVVASSDERIHVVELMELQSREGPCLDAFERGRSVQLGLADAQLRWPRFAAHAERAGYLSFSALPLRLRSQTIGVLIAFHTAAEPLSAKDMASGQALADVATIGLLHERGRRKAHVLAEQLQQALDSRVVIEQAKGVLAEKASLGIDEAFEMLRGYARRHNQRLVDVARLVVAAELDGEISAGVDSPGPP